MKQLMESSCRVAMAAYLHDLGKFAERARIAEAEEKDEHDNTAVERHKQLYCPQWNGRYSHVHAAYTAIAIDLLESYLPPLTDRDASPFTAWKGGDADDSLINAAAMHHKPNTFLQWIIATADRIASGFEREEFDDYNRAEEKTSTGRNHYTARQVTLFEQIRLEGGANKSALQWRYPLSPLSMDALFPREAEGYEHNDTKNAQREYRQLWDGFLGALQPIPESHRDNWSLWLDHFDSLWAAYASAIPSATAGNTKPEVSLYDHSRTTAALATALWRYHVDDDRESIREQLRAQWDRQRQHQELANQAWEEDKFLLVIGDFFSIQPFIFASGSETQKNAARLLRGRSAYVSLLTECAALKILDELGLPPTSQVINAAGKFLIVAPNRPQVREKMAALQAEFDQWFLQQTWGTSGIGIAWEPAACSDFLDRSRHQKGEAPFKHLMDRLFERLEDAKACRLDLCGGKAPAPVFDGFLDRFDNEKGVCAIDGRSPASKPLPKAEGKYVSPLALDQINTGKWLAHYDRLLITCGNIKHNTLSLDLFGYHVSFTGSEEASGRFGRLAASGELRRVWDYSLPKSEEAILFNGYARRNINAYVPEFGQLNEIEKSRYKGLEIPDSPQAPKSFEHLARDDQWPFKNDFDRWGGTEALMILKGDVDNLGRIFEKGLEKPSFAKWASLSRQMNAYFSVFLPWLCREKFPSTYTVFAGGDDFFLIGPWRSTIKLAREMRKEFRRYVAENPGIHFSVGLLMTKPGIPVPQMGGMAEAALEHAKDHTGKNAVTLFGQTVSWDGFDQLWHVLEAIREKHDEFELSTGYLYRLQDLADMAENLRSETPKPENAIWRSWFSYRTYRMLEQTLKGKDKQKERERRMQELATILSEPIERFGSRFKIPLFIHLYQQRSSRS